MKVKNLFVLPLLFMLTVFPEFAVSAPEGEFVSLFNGKDLSGWVMEGPQEAFVVKNESIYSTGAYPMPNWLRSEKEYENFILRFEYQTVGWYEGGFLIHAPQYGDASRMGLKLHIKHERKEYGARSAGALYDLRAPLKIANKPSGQWNQMEIISDYPKLQIRLNDELIHDLDMSSDRDLADRLRRGHIGIQGLGCQAHFRKIEIRELPDKLEYINVFPETIEGFEIIEEADWSLENNILTGKGKLGHIITKKSFEGPYQLQVWVRVVTINGNGGILPRWNDRNRGFEIQVFNTPDTTNPTGIIYDIAPARRVVSRDQEWFLIQAIVDGPYARVRVNGELVAESNNLREPYSGRIAFQQHTPDAELQFRDARIIMMKD